MIDSVLLHIGYPKTGTTTLQQTLFPAAPSVKFLGKGKAETPQSIDALRKIINYGSGFHVSKHGPTIARALTEANAGEETGKLLLSLEGFTNPFVDTHYIQPKDVLKKIDDIRTVFAPMMGEGVAVRILATLRNQTELLPSLYSQIYLQGFATGLFRSSYDSFLDFMFEDEVLGFGPDFYFDIVLDRCREHFGEANVFAASMNEVFGNGGERGVKALSSFLSLDEDECVSLIGDAKHNVRNRADTNQRKMMAVSPGVRRFEENTGASIMSKAFALTERLKIRKGESVYRSLPDRSERIAAYYAGSNARLEEKHGVAV